MEPQDRPTSSLVADALTHLSNLVRGEVALARAEVTESLRNAATGIVML
ncbi:MAG: phage holin family protein, partial [Paracoccaceae bacterium]